MYNGDAKKVFTGKPPMMWDMPAKMYHPLRFSQGRSPMQISTMQYREAPKMPVHDTWKMRKSK